MTGHDPQGVKLRILEATVQSLVIGGYGATTTLAVQRLAAVSRGTLQHHYPTRPKLMAATVRHIGAVRYREMQDSLAGLGESGQSLTAALVALRRSFSTQTFQAEIELWVAARTDAALREAIVPVERRLGQMIKGLTLSFGAVPEAKRAEAIKVAIDVMRGRAVVDALRGKPSPGAATLERDIAPLLSVLEGYVSSSPIGD